MSTLSREEVRGLLPAYALGALEVDERLALEAGLARYPELRAELAQYSAVTHGLNATVPLRRPPPSLKAGLMAQTAPRPGAKPSWWQRFIDALSDSSLAPKLAAAALVLSAAFVVIQAAMRIPLAAQQISAQQQASAPCARNCSPGAPPAAEEAARRQTKHPCGSTHLGCLGLSGICWGSLQGTCPCRTRRRNSPSTRLARSLRQGRRTADNGRTRKV